MFNARSMLGGSLLGHGTRWWTNTDLTGRNPVTRHTFDAAVIGVGNGITATVLTFENRCSP